MARVFREIEIEGKKVVRHKGAFLGGKAKDSPFSVGLGGRTHRISEACLLECAIEGLPFDIEAHPVEDLGCDKRGRGIDAIIGALAMEKWALIPNPKTGEMDLTALRKREFTEYTAGESGTIFQLPSLTGL